MIVSARLVIVSGKSPEVTVRSFDLLRTGMQLHDVETLFGRPCDEKSPYQAGWLLIWCGNNLEIEAVFDQKSCLLFGIAHDAEFVWLRSTAESKSWTEFALRFLGRFFPW